MANIDWSKLRTPETKLAEYVRAKCDWLNTERDRRVAQGIEHAGHHYQTTERSITDLMGALQVAQLSHAAGQQFTTQWLTTDNVPVTLGLPELASLGAAVAQHKAALVYKCRAHKDALLALTTQQQVDAYLLDLRW